MPFGDDGSERFLVALLVVGATVAVSGVAIGVVASGASGGSLDSGTGPSDSETVQQRNPDEVGGSESLSAMERQLADRVSRQIESGAINLSRGDYESARDSLSDSQYESLMDRYSDVAADTGNENRSDAFLRMRDRQRAYATAAERYWRLYDLYNRSANLSEPESRELLSNLSFVDANETTSNTWRSDNTVTDETLDSKTTANDTLSAESTTNSSNSTTADRESADAGSDWRNSSMHNESVTLEWNTTQRRQLARALEERWRDVDKNGTALVEAYNDLAALDDRDYSTAIQSIRASRQNVSETQRAVRDRWLVVVNLSAEAPDPRGSFTDPITITGRLEMANGTAVTAPDVEMDVAGHSYRAILGDDGRFEFDYRPTTLSLNATNVSVQFVPRPSSAYTSSPVNVSVEPEQTEPKISFRTNPTTVHFNETVTVSGHVGSDSVGARGVPILVTIDGQVLTRNETTADGTFETNASLPASIPPGTQDIDVSLLLDEQALAATNASTPVEIEERSSELSLAVDSVDGRSVQVSGRLSVPEAGGVPDEQVRLVANGTDLGTVTTGDGGRFETTVVVPNSLLGNGFSTDPTRLELQAVYANDRSNVKSSEAAQSVSIAQTPWLLIGAGVSVVLLLVLMAGYLGFSRLSRDRKPDVEPFGPADKTVGTPAGSTVSQESLLSLAYEKLDDGQTDTAVQLGYVAVRMRLERELEVTSTATPWEFYRAVQQQDNEADGTAILREMTELYEQAVFASETVSTETIRSMLDSAEM